MTNEIDLNDINKIFANSIEVKNELIKNGYLKVLAIMGDEIVRAIKSGSKILLCGNGGSAADAQHLAAEMLVRLRPAYNRNAIPAIALAQDTSTITACGNDFGYEYLFERLLQGLGKSGDILIGITTSGNSENIIKAMKEAKNLNIKVFGFLGCKGGKAINYCDEAFVVPSHDTGRIQESHITAGHALMEHVENKLIEINHIELKK